LTASQAGERHHAPLSASSPSDRSDRKETGDGG
jgi:hypothetical protein